MGLNRLTNRARALGVEGEFRAGLDQSGCETRNLWMAAKAVADEALSSHKHPRDTQKGSRMTLRGCFS